MSQPILLRSCSCQWSLFIMGASYLTFPSPDARTLTTSRAAPAPPTHSLYKNTWRGPGLTKTMQWFVARERTTAYLTAWLGCTSLCDGRRIFGNVDSPLLQRSLALCPLQLGRSFCIHYLEENNVMRKRGSFFLTIEFTEPLCGRK